MLEYLLNEIELALQNHLFFIALQSALTIPDICAALESDNGKTTRVKYAEWYNVNVKQENDFLTGEECYLYRCSCVHQGVGTGKLETYSRIVFLYPNSCFTTHNNVLNDALNIDIILFCKQILSCTRQWLLDNQNNSIVKRNYQNLIKIYPEGLEPYISGFPVIS